MHAAGLGLKDMAALTDEDDDIFRQRYAMDCYAEFVGNPKVANK